MATGAHDIGPWRHVAGCACHGSGEGEYACADDTVHHAGSEREGAYAANEAAVPRLDFTADDRSYSIGAYTIGAHIGRTGRGCAGLGQWPSPALGEARLAKPGDEVKDAKAAVAVCRILTVMSETSLPVALPPGAPGSWCLVTVSANGARWWAQVQLTDHARGHVVRQLFLGPCRGGRRKTLMHMPAEAGALCLLFIGESVTPGEITIRIVSRAGAALRLLLSGWRSGWRRLRVALRGDRLGLAGRLRATLGQAPCARWRNPALRRVAGALRNAPLPAGKCLVRADADSGCGRAR